MKETPPFLWVTGQAAAGKSTFLREARAYCEAHGIPARFLNDEAFMLEVLERDTAHAYHEHPYGDERIRLTSNVPFDEGIREINRRLLAAANAGNADPHFIELARGKKDGVLDVTFSRALELIDDEVLGKSTFLYVRSAWSQQLERNRKRASDGKPHPPEEIMENFYSSDDVGVLESVAEVRYVDNKGSEEDFRARVDEVLRGLIEGPAFERAYEAGLRMPYSSATAVYFAAGETPGERFGDNCIGQAAAVHDALVSAGFSPFYVRDGRHHAVIVRARGRITVFDPYLMHAKPIVIHGEPEIGREMEFPAHPDVACDGRVFPGILRVDFPATDTLRLRKRRYDAAKGAYEESVFTFDLRAPVDRPAPEDPAIAFSPEQTTLSIRTLDPASCQTEHLVYPVAKTHEHGTVDPSMLYAKAGNDARHARGSEEYDSCLARIAGRLGCPPEEVERFVMRSVELYERSAPRDIRYHSDNPVNN